MAGSGENKSQGAGDVPCWKGAVALSSREAARLLLRDGGVSAEAVNADPVLGEYFSRSFLATAWYPEAPAGDYIEAAARLLGRPIEAYARELGRRVVMRDAGLVGKLMLGLFVTPERLPRYADTAWARIRNTGRVEVRSLSRAHQALRVHHWRGHDPRVCPTIGGSLEIVVGAMREVRSVGVERTACVSKGARACEFLLLIERS
ncbi:MAG TPA: hypothetical protein VFS43_04380 [Polyangiaceae bacterium]|nr:hypothetical protein [Polyangiaceae bacterium]